MALARVWRVALETGGLLVVLVGVGGHAERRVGDLGLAGVGGVAGGLVGTVGGFVDHAPGLPSHGRRYACCSGVSASISTPRDSSFRRATSRSIAPGTGWTPGSSSSPRVTSSC